MLIGHTVLHDNVRDTLCIEPAGHVVALVLQCKAGIAPAGAHKDGHAVGFRGPIDGDVGVNDVGHPSAFQVLFGAGQAVAIGSTVRPQWQFDGLLSR